MASINKQQRQVRCHNGRCFDYQHLVIATGANAAIPDIDNAQADNVMGFRTIADVEQLLSGTRDYKNANACVIGGGLLGIEAAIGLKAQGFNVTLLHRNPVLMNRQLDVHAGQLLAEALTARGIQLRCGINQYRLLSERSASINTNSQPCRVNAVEYQSAGEVSPQTETCATDLVIFATGIKPNIELAQQAGLDYHKGITVNNFLLSSDAAISAFGECCQFESFTYGLVAPIWQQAEILAKRLLNAPQQSGYQEQQHLTKLKVSGLDVHSLGDIQPQKNDQVLELHDEHSGVYKKIIVRKQRLVGALCLGDIRHSLWYFDLMRSGENIEPLREQLLFGEAA